MSKNPIKLAQNKSFPWIRKWSIGVAAVIILEVLAIGTSYLITESKNKERTNRLEALTKQLNTQENEIQKLAQLRNNIADNRAKINENSGNIELYGLNFNKLKEEVGNNKLAIMGAKLDDVAHRMESVEETKNQEALILSLALIIKENSLYGKDTSHEIEILENMAKSQENIKNELGILNSLKYAKIQSEFDLINEYNLIVEDFSFEKPHADNNFDAEEKKSAVEKSIEMIKDTVAGINFDKVIKKDNKSVAEKQLLKNLGNMVTKHKFTEALTFIGNTPKFADAQNEKFNKWVADVQNKLAFDKALKIIIASELSALKEDFEGKATQEN